MYFMNKSNCDKKLITFADLKVGDIFIYNNNFLLKCENSTDTNQEHIFNAINLDSRKINSNGNSVGTIWCFKDDMIVRKLNKEIIIDYDMKDIQHYINDGVFY